LERCSPSKSECHDGPQDAVTNQDLDASCLRIPGHPKPRCYNAATLAEWWSISDRTDDPATRKVVRGSDCSKEDDAARNHYVTTTVDIEQQLPPGTIQPPGLDDSEDEAGAYVYRGDRLFAPASEARQALTERIRTLRASDGPGPSRELLEERGRLRAQENLALIARAEGTFGTWPDLDGFRSVQQNEATWLEDTSAGPAYHEESESRRGRHGGYVGGERYAPLSQKRRDLVARLRELGARADADVDAGVRTLAARLERERRAAELEDKLRFLDAEDARLGSSPHRADFRERFVEDLAELRD
jgi:hypothetical protein